MKTLANFPKITVVTPNYNQGKFIRETIRSVIDQGYPNLEYIIIDGGSTDDSVAIIKEYEQHIYYWISEPDQGMYHAINKGFKQSSGEIMCWINSDDILLKDSLFIVAAIFGKNNRIDWLQGRPTVINESSEVIRRLEHVYSPFHYYFGQHERDYSFIQQESTFWRRKVWDKSGGYISEHFKLAADFDLWMRFFRIAKLYCTNEPLGAFRLRAGQKSSNQAQYLEEAELSLQLHLKSLGFIKRLEIRSWKYFLKILGTFQLPIIKRLHGYLLRKRFKKYKVS